MKNKLKTPFTVLLTLIVVAAFAFTYYAGLQEGKNQERAKSADIHSQVQSLTATIKK